MHTQTSRPINIIFGLHPVLEAIASRPEEIDKVFVRQGLSGDKMAIIKRAAGAQKLPVSVVPDAKLKKLAGQKEPHQGIIALLSAVVYQQLEEVILGIQEREQSPLLVMLDGVTDVRNFGAIARTTECMGGHGIIIPAQGSAQINATAVQTSAGALNHLPVCRETNLVDSILMMQAYEIQTVAFTEKAEQSLFELDFRVPTCLVMGAEDKGISNSVLKRVDHMVAIPMQGKIGALNVSVSAGMGLLEVARQRLPA